MLCGKLILVVVLSQVSTTAASHEAAALVEQLGSARYADRESAAAALERMGRPALAPLRAARDSRDSEVRSRAGALAQKIEHALLTQPTPVQLEFQNTPLPDVARSLSAQTGFRIELYPANMPRWRQQRITLHESGPTDFWKAIDRICGLAGLQYNPSMHGYIGNGETVFALTDGASRTVTPLSDHGPFRVSVISIEYQKRVTYAPTGIGGHVPPPPRPAVLDPQRDGASAPPRLNPVTSEHFSAQLLVAAEPRLALSQVQPLQLTEAIDDRGNSLVPVADDETGHRRYAGYFGMATSPVIQLQAPLRRPLAAGQLIKKLRGSISLTVSARRPYPLVVPLVNSVGKTFENQDHRLTIHDVRPTPTNHNLLLDLSIKANDSAPSDDRPQDDAFSDGFQRADPQHLQIEVVDATGRIVPWFQSAADVEASRFTLTLTNQVQPSHLKELRYYTLTRAPVKIPFEFTDIPMP